MTALEERCKQRLAWLGALTSGRENNLNLLRMIAACAVLVSHAYPLTRGPEALQPLEKTLGFSLGQLAVSTFFVISGLLISQSFERRRDVVDFILARALRIFPALFIVLALTALVLGPLTTDLTLVDYFSRRETATYVPQNLSLAFLQYGLPGVFLDNPYPGAINGSLWSLFFEAACYAGVLALGLLELKLGALRPSVIIIAYAAAYLAIAVAAQLVELHPKLATLHHMSFPFFVGMVFWRLRRRILLHAGLLAIAVVLLVLMASTAVVYELFIVAWAYVVIYLAYSATWPFLLRYNALGDFSYGFYILAFPTQQLVVHVGLATTPAANILWAFAPTLALAILSWTLIEKRALKARAPLVGAFHGVFARASRPRVQSPLPGHVDE